MGLIHYERGDCIIFVKDWDPGFAPDDPFYIEPVPKGTRGRVVDVGPNKLRLQLADKEIWPQPVTIWFEGAFPDAIEGTKCIAHQA